MLLNIRACLLIALWVSVHDATAALTYPDFLIEQAEFRRLAINSEWLALGHYRAAGESWHSETRDKNFFNAVDGAEDPVAEMVATIRAFFNADIEPDDNHPQCRFPARLVWLIDALNIDVQYLPPVKCAAFAEWYQHMQPSAVTIIFPAAYLNNPSSMFGHTFLRIDGNNQTDQTRLLAYSLGYAADILPDSNPLEYIYKGLFGGYPGSFTGAPYYEKVIEYGDIEARDIWEYELDFTQDEVDRIIRHAWELQHIKFDYYFFDQNCSYQLLALLDVARPGLKLVEGFEVHAIPADTVRRLVERKLVRNKSYRPATVTRILDKMEILSETQQEIAYGLAQATERPSSAAVEKLDEVERIRVLDLAYEYSRYLVQEYPERRQELASVSMELLRARSRLPALKEQYNGSPPVSPEDGHATTRLEVGAGRLEKADFQSLRFRPAFHDMLDSDQGYTSGAQINFLDFELRHYSETGSFDNNDWELEYFELVGIESLALRNHFFKPFSWKINAGWRRFHELSDDDMRFGLDAGWGATYGVRDKVLFYGLLGAGLRAQTDLLDDHEGSVSGSAGALFSIGANTKLRVETRRREYDGVNASDGLISSLQFNQSLTSNVAIRLEYEKHSLEFARFAQLRVGFRWYF